MKLATLMCVMAMIWSAAVLLKLATARSRGEPYRFTQWDGGLMLRGTTLGGAGMVGFAVFVAVLGSIAAYELVHWARL
ncbi:MAG: hypothetical protein JWO36_4124 [Myxococcales bacterium]|nr:hypothetical protein [Myxococcales bacterium]